MNSLRKKVSLASFVVASTRPAVGEAVIGQDLEPEGGDRLLACEIQIEDAPFGDASRGKDRAVLHDFQFGQVGLHGIRFERAPRGCFFFLGLAPRGKGLIKVRIVFLSSVILSSISFSRSGFLLCLSLRVEEEVGLFDVIEQTHQPEVLVMSDGVVLVGVTLSATGGQAHPDRAGGGDPVDRGVETEFQGIDSAFFVELGVSVKPSGGFLILRSVGQHVPGQLLDGELVVGHIVIESPDHPVAVGPDVAGTIFLVAIAVGVAGEVEPLASPLFPVAREASNSSIKRS